MLFRKIFSTIIVFFLSVVFVTASDNMDIEFSTESGERIEILVGESIESGLDERIPKLVRVFDHYKSPIANHRYARIVINESEKHNADYRINVGLMVAESGLCKVPLKSFNCYGYLNGVYYESFDDALSILTSKISQQYTEPFGWNLDTFLRIYGVHNPDAYKKKVFYVARQIDREMNEQE